MMKFLLTSLLLFTAACLGAQSMGKNTFSSAGIELSGQEVTVSFTIGEPIIGLIANNESIDQGFWAGSLYVEPITPEKELGGIVVYPNPVIDQLNIETNNNAVYGITLFAVNGKQALQQKVDATLLEHKIDLSHLAKGMYVLRLSIEKDEQGKLFKIIKK
ncbi:MAG: T9SS type A sorting domain-containing protein [Aurantibacter sp.]